MGGCRFVVPYRDDMEDLGACCIYNLGCCLSLKIHVDKVTHEESAGNKDNDNNKDNANDYGKQRECNDRQSYRLTRMSCLTSTFSISPNVASSLRKVVSSSEGCMFLLTASFLAASRFFALRGLS